MLLDPYLRREKYYFSPGFPLKILRKQCSKDGYHAHRGAGEQKTISGVLIPAGSAKGAQFCVPPFPLVNVPEYITEKELNAHGLR
jgi:hypothetical protein